MASVQLDGQADSPTASPSTVAPYEYPYCDFFVVVTHCPHSDVHVPLKIMSLVLSVVAVAMTFAYFAMRRIRGHPIVTGTGRVGAIDGTLTILAVSLLLRAIDAGLVVTDGYVNFYARYIVMVLPWAMHYQAGVFFLYAIAHSIPNAYMDTAGKIHSTLLPPRWIFVLFNWVCAVGVSLGITAAGIYLGYNYEEQGGLPATSSGYKVLFSVWSIFLPPLAFAFSYYGNRLIAVIRYNSTSSGRVHSVTMMRAIRRMKLLIYLIAPNLMALALTTILMAIFIMDVFKTPIASYIVAFLFHSIVQVFQIFTCCFLIALEFISSVNVSTSSAEGAENGTPSHKNGSASNKDSHRQQHNNNNNRTRAQASTILQEAIASLVEIDEHHQPLSLQVLAL